MSAEPSAPITPDPGPPTPGASGFVEVWQDTVTVRDLVISLVVVVALTLGGYLVAPGEPPQPLVLGLVGALVGFLICTFAFKPKRDVIVTEAPPAP